VEELTKTDRKTWKTLKMCGWHHPRVDMDRLYISRKRGERETIQTGAYKAEIINIITYLGKLCSRKTP
jgi:hypothetical protein